MPVRFLDSAAEWLFYFFLILTLVSTAIHLALLLKKPSWILQAASPFPMLFFAFACVCLAPKNYLVYLSQLLLATGVFFFHLKESFHGRQATALFLTAVFLTGAAHLIVFTECVRMLSYPLPFYIYLLFGLGLCAVGGGYRLVFKRASFDACIEAAFDCIPLIDWIVALLLVIDKPLYATIFVFTGCGFSFFGEVIHRFHTPKNAFNAYLFRYLGAVILHTGLILCMSALA